MANIEHINQVITNNDQQFLMDSLYYRKTVIDYFLITLPLLLIHNSLIRYRVSVSAISQSFKIYNYYQHKYANKISGRSWFIRFKFKCIVSLTRIYAPLVHMFKSLVQKKPFHTQP